MRVTVNRLIEDPGLASQAPHAQVHAMLAELASRQAQLAAAALALSVRIDTSPAVAVPSRLMTVKEVAARTGFTEQSVRGLLWRGDIESVRVGRYWRVSESALRRFMDQAGQERV
jgi:excisionase family DNA binding protein